MMLGLPLLSLHLQLSLLLLSLSFQLILLLSSHNFPLISFILDVLLLIQELHLRLVCSTCCPPAT